MKAAAIAPVVQQKIEIPYSYVAGPAVTRFLAGLKEGKFVASVCAGCGIRNVPPLSFCCRCWLSISEYTEVGPEGTLESFAAVPHAAVELPGGSGVVTYGLVRLDGASTLLAHLILSDRPPSAGARVRPQWREERTGSILDLGGFQLQP